MNTKLKMKLRTLNEFPEILGETHTENRDWSRFICQSTMAETEVDDKGYVTSITSPGTAYLWFHGDFHLNREEVCDVIDALTEWVNEGELKI